jgi:hypothetical protein
MRIVFERTGGFAGRRIQGALESSSLSEPQIGQLRELLDRSHFFRLPAKLISKHGGADRFYYRITVESDDGVHTVEAAEAAIPPHLRALLDWLTRSFFMK